MERALSIAGPLSLHPKKLGRIIEWVIAAQTRGAPTHLDVMRLLLILFHCVYLVCNFLCGRECFPPNCCFLSFCTRIHKSSSCIARIKFDFVTLSTRLWATLCSFWFCIQPCVLFPTAHSHTWSLHSWNSWCDVFLQLLKSGGGYIHHKGFLATSDSKFNEVCNWEVLQNKSESLRTTCRMLHGEPICLISSKPHLAL